MNLHRAYTAPMARPKKSEHYVNNKDFLAALEVYAAAVERAKLNDEPKPQIPKYIGECFLKIANHLSYKPNFVNYMFKDDMICDGIENCVRYIHNFNPEKSKNPFAYFTQIIYYAFLRRITKEKKQQSIKQKIIDNDTLKTHDVMEYDDDVYDNTYIDFLKDNLPREEAPKKKKRKKGIENFIEEDLL